MDKTYEFEAELQKVSVTATFDGIEYEGSLVRMKTPNHIIGVRKDIRERI